jgi:CHAD domain-containing protein
MPEPPKNKETNGRGERAGRSRSDATGSRNNQRQSGQADGDGQSSRLIVLPSSIEAAGRSAVPPHLAEVGWIEHEARCAMVVYRDLRRELTALKKKVSATRVHRARVTLRRWSSLWNVLRKDGWETDKYNKRIGERLRELQKLLGELRDLDVNIEQGERLGCSQQQLERWSKKRPKLQKKLETFVKQQDLSSILSELRKYLVKRPAKIRAKLAKAKAEQSAFNHLELYLLKQESIVREQAEQARTPDEFHRLRLGIKKWRYLLTEFFGVTNLELVRAQQILGQMHDLDRLTPDLSEGKSEQEALEKLKKKHKQLLGEIEEMRRRLPYGLRPQIISTKPSLPAGLPR